MNDIEAGQTYEFDLFRPEDAEGVCRLFRTVYGEGYPIRTFIEPTRLIEENAALRTISSVARTPKGDIVGHVALFHSAPYERICESGGGLVHPFYRGGKGVYTGLGIHTQEVTGKRFGIEVIFGEPVCNHVFAQKGTAKVGWITHAVELDLMPAEAYEQEKSASGRVSALLDFKTLIPKQHHVYLPPVYEEALQFLYGGLDDERDFHPAHEDFPSGSASEARTQFFDFAKVARLAFHEAGTDFRNVLEREERSVLEKGAVVLQVWLKLSRPWVGRAVEDLRSKGYFLGGILPRWFDVDGLLMQKTTATPNWEGIQLYQERAKRVLAIAREDWTETRR